MAIPTSKTNRPAIGRGSSRNNSRSPAARVIPRAVPDQIRIVVRNPRRVARWLNIACVYRLIRGDLLLEVADGDIERGTGEQVRGGIMVARLGKLPVGGSAGEIRNAQSSSKHDKGENDDQRSASRCAIRRM